MDRHTQVIQNVIVYGLHFVQHGFWFCELQMQTLVHLTALSLSIFVYIYIFFSFLTITSMPSMNIVIQEWGKKPNSSYEEGWAGNVSFGYLLSPFRLFLSKLNWLSEAKLHS